MSAVIGDEVIVGTGSGPTARAVRIGWDLVRNGPGVVVSNASALVLTTLITSALGVVFWWLAAQHFVPASVGLAAATVSASQLLGTLCVLGLGTFLITELPGAQPEHRSALVSTAVFVSSTLGIVVGVVFAMIAPIFTRELQPLQGDIVLTTLFALAVSSTAAGAILDQVAIGSLQTKFQLWRNVVYAVGKLGVLAAVTSLAVGNQALIIFAAWPIGNVLSLVLLTRLLATSPRAIGLSRPRLHLIRRLGGAGISHHALNLSLQFPSMILPMVVTVMLSATANAFFYTAWMAANLAVLPQNALAMTLFAVGVHEPNNLARRTRLTLGLGLLAALVAIAVLYVAGNLMLGVFGHTYAEEASAALRILALAVFPLIIKNHCMVLFRIQRRVLAGAASAAAGAAVEVAGAAVGAQAAGLPGLCIGWLIALSCEAGVMLPTVVRSAGWFRASAQPRADV